MTSTLNLIKYNQNIPRISVCVCVLAWEFEYFVNVRKCAYNDISTVHTCAYGIVPLPNKLHYDYSVAFGIKLKFYRPKNCLKLSEKPPLVE